MQSSDNLSRVQANQLLESDNPLDVKKGMVLIKSRADAGDPYAMYATAKWYRTGFGGYPTDETMDNRLTRIAADSLVPDAVYDLGAKSDGDLLICRQKALGYHIVSAIMGDLDAMQAVLDLLRYTDTAGKDNTHAAAILEEYMDSIVRPYKEELRRSEDIPV